MSINAEQFMKIFLQLLKKGHLSNMEPEKEIIPMFENKLESFVDISECVNIIEKYDTLPLDAKVNIAVQFRDYVNNMYCRSTQFCGEEASSEMRKNILDMSLAKLDDYLRVSIDNGVNHNEISSSLKSYLKVSTKNYLIGKLKKGEFGLKDFENEVVSEFFEKYNDREQKIWLFAAIYGIAGYDRNDKSIETDQMDEICEFLGISKLKYKKIVFVMGLRTLKNILNQLDIDSTDEKLHKKRKKDSKPCLFIIISNDRKTIF